MCTFDAFAFSLPSPGLPGGAPVLPAGGLASPSIGVPLSLVPFVPSLPSPGLPGGVPSLPQAPSQPDIGVPLSLDAFVFALPAPSTPGGLPTLPSFTTPTCPLE